MLTSSLRGRTLTTTFILSEEPELRGAEYRSCERKPEASTRASCLQKGNRACGLAWRRACRTRKFERSSAVPRLHRYEPMRRRLGP